LILKEFEKGREKKEEKDLTFSFQPAAAHRPNFFSRKQPSSAPPFSFSRGR
jgi:hypothetical protein